MKKYGMHLIGAVMALLLCVAFTAVPAQADNHSVEVDGSDLATVQSKLDAAMTTAADGDTIAVSGTMPATSGTITIHYTKKVTVNWYADWTMPAGSDVPALHVTSAVSDWVKFFLSGADIDNPSGNVLQVDDDQIQITVQYGLQPTAVLTGGGANSTIVHKGAKPLSNDSILLELTGVEVENTASGIAVKGNNIRVNGAHIRSAGTPIEADHYLAMYNGGTVTAQDPALPAVKANQLDLQGEAVINGNVEMIGTNPKLKIKYETSNGIIHGDVDLADGVIDADGGRLVIDGTVTSSNTFALANVDSATLNRPVYLEMGGMNSTVRHGINADGDQVEVVVKGDAAAPEYVVLAFHGAKITIEGAIDASSSAWNPFNAEDQSEVHVLGDVVLGSQPLASYSGGTVRIDGAVTTTKPEEFLQYVDAGVPEYFPMTPLPPTQSIDGKDYYHYSHEVGGVQSNVYIYWRDTPSSSSSGFSLRFDTNGGEHINSVHRRPGVIIDLNNYQPVRDGYVFDGWCDDEALQNPVEQIKLEKTTTVYAKWREALATPDSPLPFTDVTESDWFYGDVRYMFENGLMVGVSDTLFAPQTGTTRGMIVAMLHRLHGSPSVYGVENPFSDVADDQWYRDAIVWASREGIVSGYGDGLFGPNDLITREQMAAILMNDAAKQGKDVTVRADVSIYKDADAISDWAMDAVAWANAVGLISGDGDALMPTDTATRAQVAAIFHRYVTKIIL